MFSACLQSDCLVVHCSAEQVMVEPWAELAGRQHVTLTNKLARIGPFGLPDWGLLDLAPSFRRMIVNNRVTSLNSVVSGGT